MAARERRGTIACGDHNTAGVMRGVLDDGGTAVCEPMMTSLGGGVLFTCCVDGKLFCIDGMPRMPQTRERPPLSQIMVDFGTTQHPFWIGPGSVSCEGTLSALIHVHRKYGTLPWERVVLPSARLARDGIRLGRWSAKTFQYLESIINSTPEARRLYMKCRHGGSGNLDDAASFAPLNEGDLYQNEALAVFLERVARDPSPELLRPSYDAVGIEYQSLEVTELEPLIVDVGDHLFVTMNEVYPGGLLCACMLDQYGRTDAGEQREMRVARALLQADRVRREMIDGHWGEAGLKSNVLGSTTHLSVVDEWGNAVSVTTSNGEGSGVMLADVGIMTNNFLGEQDLHPLGFWTHTEGSRLPSMMAPSILFKKKKKDARAPGSGELDLIGAIGTGGSERIPAMVMQVALSIAEGRPLLECVTAPRMHWDRTQQVLHAEIDGEDERVLENIRKALGAEVVAWTNRDIFFGGVHCATVQGAAGDARRSGCTA